MPPRVLISDKLSPAAVAIFKERGVEVDVKPGLDKDELAEIIGEYDGLAIRSNTKVTAKLLEKATRLKVVGRAGIGVDNVDIPAATARGVIVMNTPFGNSITTAEHAIAMMFALAREIPAADASTQAGKWEKNRFMGVEITAKTLGDHRLRQHRLDRRRARARPEDARHRLRPVPQRGARAGARRREGRSRRAARARRLHHAAHAADGADEEHPLRREPRQDQEGRAHHQLRARRPRRRGRACAPRSTAAMSPAPPSTCSVEEPAKSQPAVRPSQRRRDAASRRLDHARRRRTSRCRSPSRCRTI